MVKPTRLTQELIDDYIARGYWDTISIADTLKRNARQYPHREAIVDSKTRFTWSELKQIADRVATGLLEMGIKRDQAIVVQVPSSTTTLVLLMACHQAGIVTCFPPMTFRHREMRYVLKTLRAAGVVTVWKDKRFDFFTMIKEIASDVPQLNLVWVVDDNIPQGALPFTLLREKTLGGEDCRERLQKYAFDPFEVSVIVLSSGTTGVPKLIEHTGASLKAAGWGVVERAKLTKEDVFGIIAPLSGGPGLQTWWAALQLGAKVCLLEHFTPEEALELIERERVTFLSAVPTQLIRMLKEANVKQYELSSLKVIRTGAAALDASLAKEAEARLNCKVVIAGGSQETHSFAQSGVDDPQDKRLQTVGKPFPGNEIKIVNDQKEEVPVGRVGELLVRGAATSSGYYENPIATLSAWGEFGGGGWFRTGDLAKVDEEGYLILVGRKKGMILRGGQNIYPREIEDLLVSHPKVKQAAVVGIPDSIMGERACACVTVVAGQEFAFEEMTSFLRQNGLAIHKLPERLEVLQELPSLADGQKVDRLLLTQKIVKKLKTAGKV